MAGPVRPRARRAIIIGILPLLGVWALSAGVVAAATGATGSGIDAIKLRWG